ncbi:MAG: heparan-alpha-glucosaminide N-acetyltransferase domain-containing protein [Promethearchaeota archaeon]
MTRFKSVDIFRGLCIFYMIFGHMIYWWISPTDTWLYEVIWNYGAIFGGGGFLLVSGMSAALLYKRGLVKAQNNQEFSLKTIRNEYIIRASLILFISMIWNTIGTIYMGLPGVWLWFVLQTISISLLMVWPLLKTSKIFRIFICFISWISNEFIYVWLTPYAGQENILGYFFYFLYNSPEQNVILGYFPFLLLGTVIGDILFDAGRINNLEKQHSYLKNKLFKPIIIGGFILIFFGLGYKFPNIANKETFSSHMFILGFEFLIFAFLVFLKDYRRFKLKRSYKFFEFYSFYSFTMFLSHHLLFFLFQPQFNSMQIWFLIIPIIIIWTLLFRILHKNWEKYISLKFLINKSAIFFARKIDLIKPNKPYFKYNLKEKFN